MNAAATANANTIALTVSTIFRPLRVAHVGATCDRLPSNVRHRGNRDDRPHVIRASGATSLQGFCRRKIETSMRCLMCTFTVDAVTFRQVYPIAQLIGTTADSPHFPRSAGMQARRFSGVVARMQIVTVREIRFTRRLLVSTGAVVRRWFSVVLRRVLKMWDEELSSTKQPLDVGAVHPNAIEGRPLTISKAAQAAAIWSEGEGCEHCLRAGLAWRPQERAALPV